MGGLLALLVAIVQQLPAQGDGRSAAPSKRATDALAMPDHHWIRSSTAEADIYVLGGSRAERLLPKLPAAVQRAFDADLAFLGESFSGAKLQIFIVGADDDLTSLIGGRAFGSSNPQEGTTFIVGNDSMPPALRHEIMHLLLWRLWGPLITPWLSEGVAARATGACGGNTYAAIAAELGRERKLVRLDTLFTNFNFAWEQGAIYYIEAASLVDYIDRAFGRKRLRALWATGGHEDLRSLLGVDLPALERGWRVAPAVGAMSFWDDTTRYLYLPRLKSRNVLEQAIINGAGSRDFFGTAYGQHDGAFEGFKFGEANVQLDDTLLLIEPEVAKSYQVANPSAPGAGAALTDFGGIGSSPTPGKIKEPPPGTGGPGIATAPRARAFHGNVVINAATAKMRMVLVADEIIAVLAADPNADIKIAVEIQVNFPAGATDQTKRAVTENARTLNFRNADWE